MSIDLSLGLLRALGVCRQSYRIGTGETMNKWTIFGFVIFFLLIWTIVVGILVGIVDSTPGLEPDEKSIAIVLLLNETIKTAFYLLTPLFLLLILYVLMTKNDQN